MVSKISNWEGNIRGFGPIDFQQTGRFHRCRNIINSCPTDYDSGCCKLGVCRLCITWQPYGDAEKYGTLLPTDVDTYAGSVSVYSVEVVWEDRSGSCWLVLYIDGEEKGAVEKCQSGTEVVSCLDPGYTFEDIELDYVTGDIIIAVEPIHKLARNLGTPPGQCKVAIALVWDRNWRQDIATQDIQSSGLTNAVNQLIANSDEYSLATVIYNDSTDSTHTAFATNNGTAWLADIETITTSGGSTSTVDYHRASDLGLETAVSSLTWPADATRKIIVLVNQGRPGRSSPVADANAYELAQLASATSAAAAGITVHSVQVPNIVGSIPTHYFDHGPGNEGVAASTATNGGGSYRNANPDGTAGYNSGVKEVVTAIEDLFEGVSCPGGACATEHACGDCACDRLCLTVNRTDPLCNGTSVLEWNASDGCEKNGWNDPQWAGSIEVVCGDTSLNSTFDVELFLGEDEYGNCTIYGNATSYGDSAYALDDVIISDGESITATWTLDDQDASGGTITFTVSCLICDTCSGIEVDCCPDVLLPGILYADFTQLVAGDDDCSCAEGIVTLNNLFLQGSPAEPAGQWTSGLMAWAPCTGTPEYWSVTLTCTAGVWTLAVSWFDATETQIAGTTNQPDAEVCDPLELTFTGDGLGSIIPSGTCSGGITPATNEVVVTL